MRVKVTIPSQSGEEEVKEKSRIPSCSVERTCSNETAGSRGVPQVGNATVLLEYYDETTQSSPDDSLKRKVP